MPPVHPQQGQGCEVPAFAGATGGRRVNDAYDQCKGWRGDGAMGSCRWVGGYVWDGVTFGRFANRPYTKPEAGIRGSRLRGNDGRSAHE